MTLSHTDATDTGTTTLATQLIWAQLAYLADGPDPFLALLAKVMENPQTLLRTMAEIGEETLRSDTKTPSSSSQAFRDLFRCAEQGHDQLGTTPNRFMQKHLLERCRQWAIRYRDIRGKSEDELSELFTCRQRYQLVTPDDVLWPGKLDDLLLRAHSAPPLCLWVAGAPQTLQETQGAVAIVGSREADDYGERCAHSLAARVASTDHLVISGGAMGIDASAHWGALSTRFESPNDFGTGATIAIFAGGLRNIGPSRNLRLFDEILSHSGALISELPPETVPHSSRFLARNRLIAALSDCIVVAQARYRSGALNTAQWGIEMGRSVLAIPGSIESPNNAGCNRIIIEQKASMMASIEDIDGFLLHDSPPTPLIHHQEAPPSSSLFDTDGPVTSAVETGTVKTSHTDVPTDNLVESDIVTGSLPQASGVTATRTEVNSVTTGEALLDETSFLEELDALIVKKITGFRALGRDDLISRILVKTPRNSPPNGIDATVINQRLGMLELLGKVRRGSDGRFRMVVHKFPSDSTKAIMTP